jgi:hypothetical protein
MKVLNLNVENCSVVVLLGFIIPVFVVTQARYVL